MAVRIRLTRVGATKRPSYRVVAIEGSRARDGRSLEILGIYNPLTEPATVELNEERLNAWISNGATPSEAVQRLMRQAGIGGEAAAPKPRSAAKPKPPKRTRKKAEPSAAAAPATEAAATEPEAADAPTKAAADDAAVDEAKPAVDEPAADEPAADAATSEEAAE